MVCINCSDANASSDRGLHKTLAVKALPLTQPTCLVGLPALFVTPTSPLGKYHFIKLTD
jgi:hypothetical protein